MKKTDSSDFLKPFLYLSPFFIIAIMATWLVSGNIFFWDTVQLGAKHATFYYENNFSKLLLPDNMDSGHIPAFGMYLALCWKLFGKSLLVSHFAMLPFLLGIIWQSYLLFKKFFSPEYLFFALILFFLDPTLLSQAILISPDVVLVFLFLIALNSVLEQKRITLSVAAAGLSLISTRGMMVAFAILLLDIIKTVKPDSFRSVFIQLTKKAFVYLPALIIFLSFNIYHYKSKGWISYHDESPWAECFQRVDFKGFVYNIGILGWRILDFGRVFLWIAFFGTGIFYLKKIKTDDKIKTLFLMFVLLIASLSVSFVLYKNLSGHRYILPAILSFSMLVSYLVFEVIESKKLKYVVFSVLATGLITGNLWVYPRDISQGWDASLAHLPYYELREKMNSYMQEQNISIEETASFFPNNIELKYIDLSDSETKHSSFDSKSEYVLFSNIYNDATTEERNYIRKNFLLEKEYKKRGIYLRLYKKNN